MVHEATELKSAQTQAKTHDELIHTMCLLVAMMTRAELKTDENLSSMYNVIWRCESINSTPYGTVPTVKLVDDILSLLETSESLV